MSCSLIDKISNAIYNLSLDKKYHECIKRLSNDLVVITCMQNATSFILRNDNNNNDDDSSSSSNDNNLNLPYVELSYSIHRLVQSLLLRKQQQQENEGEIIKDDKNSDNKNNKKEQK